MAQATSFPVKLYIYDLSLGLAKWIAPLITGEEIKGIWHTSIVVYGEEFYFSTVGILTCSPGGTPLGEPKRVEELGSTKVTQKEFLKHLVQLDKTTFRGEKYSLLEHNCNTFSNEMAKFLEVDKIPSYILNLPGKVLSTPISEAIAKVLAELTKGRRITEFEGGVIFPLLNSDPVNPGGDSATGQQ